MMNIQSLGSGIWHGEGEVKSDGIHLNGWVLLEVMSGEVCLEWSSHRSLAQAPALFVIAPNLPHQLAAVGKEAAYRFVLLEDGQWAAEEGGLQDTWNRWNLSQGAGATELMPSHTALRQHVHESYAFLFRMLDTGAMIKSRKLMRICEMEIEKIGNMIAYLLMEAPAERHDPVIHHARRQSEEAVYTIRNFLERKYREHVTVTMLADLVHMNPSYLIRMFKEYTGYTPAKFIRCLRLKAAEAYLLEGDMPIKDIAMQTGFNSIHYFTRMFKLDYGESPARWRGRIRRKE